MILTRNQLKFIPLCSCAASSFYFLPYTSKLVTVGNKNPRHFHGGDLLVGMAGFEPTTSCTPSKRATGLRYIPNNKELLFEPTTFLMFQSGCATSRRSFFDERMGCKFSRIFRLDASMCVWFYELYDF
jgi:hypothetical protein